MKIAIMQPYLFPYIGYFQLINAVDKFVIHDDVKYRKGGWINRNRILVNGKEHMFTFSVAKDSSYLNIMERHFTPDFKQQKQRFLRTVQSAYGRAPHAKGVLTLLSDILSVDDTNVSSFVTLSLRAICDYIGIRTQFLLSSELQKDNTLRAQERVIEINRRLGSEVYINPIGGTDLYSKETFSQNGLVLHFIKSRATPYTQFSNSFVPFLSIIDVLMFNSRDQVQVLLGEYDLL